MPQTRNRLLISFLIILIIKGKLNDEFFLFFSFSLWRVEYEKYPGEGEKLYMTKNLSNGFV